MDRSAADAVVKARLFGSLREKLDQASDVFYQWMSSWNKACGSLLLVGGSDLLDLMLHDLEEKRKEIMLLEQKVYSVKCNHNKSTQDLPVKAGDNLKASASLPQSSRPKKNLAKQVSVTEKQRPPGKPERQSSGNGRPEIIRTLSKPDQNSQTPYVLNDQVQKMISVALQTAASAPSTASNPPVLTHLNGDKVLAVRSSVEPVEAFEGMKLKDTLQAKIKNYGFEAPLSLQCHTIPACLSGRNYIIQAPNKSGKTSSLAISALQKVDFTNPACQVLVIVPTREHAQEVQTDFMALGDSLGVVCHSCTSGNSSEVDVMKLQAKPSHVIVGTPGRLYELIKIRQVLLTDQVQMVVLDGGDKLLGPGFKEQVENILELLPKSRQDILFCDSEATTELSPPVNLFAGSPPESIGASVLSVALDGVCSFVVPSETSDENGSGQKSLLRNLDNRFGEQNMIILSKSADSAGLMENRQGCHSWVENTCNDEAVFAMAKGTRLDMIERFRSRASSSSPDKLNVVVFCDPPNPGEFISWIKLNPLAHVVLVLVPYDRAETYRKEVQENCDGLLLLQLAQDKL